MPAVHGEERQLRAGMTGTTILKFSLVVSLFVLGNVLPFLYVVDAASADNASRREIDPGENGDGLSRANRYASIAAAQSLTESKQEEMYNLDAPAAVSGTKPLLSFDTLHQLALDAVSIRLLAVCKAMLTPLATTAPKKLLKLTGGRELTDSEECDVAVAVVGCEGVPKSSID